MIEIKNLCKTYAGKKGSPSVRALDDVSLTLEETGMVFILGKSGSGKSTLLNVAGGLDTYDSGEIVIKGKSSKDFTQNDFDSYRNTFIGFIFQEYNVLEEFTVGANIALAMELQGVKASKDALDEILAQVELTEFASRKPSTLSGGQKQRVAIARALIKKPEIIMADEPTGALDSATGKQVLDTLKELSKTKLVLVVSHDREFAERYGDRVIEMKDGKIISDITKFHAEPTMAGEGIQFIGDTIMHIKKGYELSANDLNAINAYLKRAHGDAIISVDERSNADFKQVARITDDGRKESFKDTQASDVAVKEYNPEDFKLIRSRLPYKNSLKMGASSLRGKPFRLFFTILLCFISFALFGLADTVAAYDKVNNAALSIRDTNIKTASFVKMTQEKRNNYTYRRESMFGESDLAELKEKTGVDFKPVYGGSYIYNRLSIQNFQSSFDGGQYYTSDYTGITALSQEELNSMGADGLVGQMPREENEVLISQYLYEQFKLGGYSLSDRAEPITISAADMTKEKLLGQILKVDIEHDNNIKFFKIVGIIDTHLDSRYDSLKPNSGGQDGDGNDENMDLSDMTLTEMIFAELGYGLHGMLIMSESGLKSCLPTVYGEETKLGHDDSLYFATAGQQHGGSIETLISDTEAATDGYNLFYFGNNSALRDGECMVSGDALSQISRETQIILDAGDVASLNGQTYVRADQLFDFRNVLYRVNNYCSDLSLFNSIPESFVTKILKDRYDIDYTFGMEIGQYEYQISYEYEEYLENAATPGKDGGLFVNAYGGQSLYERAVELYQKYFQKYSSQLSVGNIMMSSGKGENMPYAIKGVILPPAGMAKTALESRLSNDQRQEDHVYLLSELLSRELGIYSFNDAFVAPFKETSGQYFKTAIAPMPTGAELKRLLDVHYDPNEEGVRYTMRNSVTSMLGMVESIIDVLAQVFLYVGIGFAVFASLMMFNFISASIANKRREIGILRAVGAKSSDVFGIFFNESLIITIINVVLSVIATAVGAMLINNALRTQAGLVITILSFGIRQIAIMTGIGVLVALIASFLPVYRIAKKRPIEAIRG